MYKAARFERAGCGLESYREYHPLYTSPIPAPPFDFRGSDVTANIRVFQTRSEGSIPSSRISPAHVAKLDKATVCKAVHRRFESGRALS